MALQGDETMIQLIKGQRKSNLDYRDNLMVNMTAVAEDIEGDQGYIIAHDGLTEFATTSGTARGAFFNERLNRHFRVSGDYFESISSTGVVTTIGAVPGSGVCQFSESFNTQAVLSAGRLWLYDGFSLTEVTDPELGAPIDITQFNQIYVMTDGQYLFHTDINNEFSISPLKYSSSEFSADPIKGVIRTDSNQIIAFNRYSTEVFYFNANAPTGTSVLQRIEGAATTVGIIGTKCKCKLDGGIFILGGRKDESPSIYLMGNGGPQGIATREIDKIISQYDESELENVFMESRVVDRDKFLIVHLPNETLLYNLTVSQRYGNEMAWSFVKSGSDSPWRARYGIFDPRAGVWIYGDTQENKLAYLDRESFAQYGEAQEALFYTPILPLQQRSIAEISIDTIPGYSTSDVDVAFSMSFDGVGWGSEHWNKVSMPNNYNTNYIIRALGYVSRSVSFRFRFISEDKMAFSGVTPRVA